MKVSTRETQILGLLQAGSTNKEIAQSLGISPHTVRDHISGMLSRYGLGGRTALAALHISKARAADVRQEDTRGERRATADRRAQTVPKPEPLQM